MTIIEYNNATDMKVKFEDGSIKKCEYSKFKKGLVKSQYDKTVFNVGFIGEGKVEEYIQIIWRDMIKRCYSSKVHSKYSTYKDCTVCDEWLNYQNFSQWFKNNYYEVDNEIMDLDKDILYKGNKIYSPENCIFVPHKINSMLTKSDKVRGKFPIGVTYDNNKYVARCECGNVRIHLGRFNTKKEAFYKYKAFKENYIKKVAEQYKSIIPTKLYNALLLYKVEITD